MKTTLVLILCLFTFTGILQSSVTLGLYWTDDTANAIMRSNLDGTNVHQVVGGIENPLGIAVTNEHIYWSDGFTNTIQRSNLNGSNVTTLVQHSSNPNDIAIAGSYIYWANEGADSIMRSNLDGTNTITLVQPRWIAEITSITVSNNYVFWSDTPQNTIWRTNLGSLVSTAIVVGKQAPLGIAPIDNDYLYFVNNGRNEIIYWKIIGADSVVYRGDIYDPRDVLINENYLYISDSNNGIFRTELDHYNLFELVDTDSHQIGSLAIGAIPELSSFVFLVSALFFSILRRWR